MDIAQMTNLPTTAETNNQQSQMVDIALGPRLLSDHSTASRKTANAKSDVLISRFSPSHQPLITPLLLINITVKLKRALSVLPRPYRLCPDSYQDHIILTVSIAGVCSILYQLVEMSNEVTSSHLTYTELSFVSGQPLQMHFRSHHSCSSLDFNVVGSTDDSTPCFRNLD
eukprot:scaffold243200_cov66-Cyclotella_meneghiniana.AAC.4